ncbi:MAG: helix-turn-helix transcriptional regulator [Clostridia bacterium]|nr:helix-turn-helix transcriptional regulator [Clostridia bacterium]
MKQSYEELGKNIAYYRRRAGLTQDMLSMQMGVSMQAVSKWERSISSPDVSLLPPLAQALGVTIDALFALPEEHAPLLYIEDVPWEDDNEYRLALFHGKVLLNRQTHLCQRGGDLIAHIRIPEGNEEEEC